MHRDPLRLPRARLRFALSCRLASPLPVASRCTDRNAGTRSTSSTSRRSRRCTTRACARSSTRRSPSLPRRLAMRVPAHPQRCSRPTSSAATARGPRAIPCRAGYRAVRDTVPCEIPCRAGYHAARDTMPQPPCRRCARARARLGGSAPASRSRTTARAPSTARRATIRSRSSSPFRFATTATPVPTRHTRARTHAHTYAGLWLGWNAVECEPRVSSNRIMSPSTHSTEARGLAWP